MPGLTVKDPANRLDLDYPLTDYRTPTIIEELVKTAKMVDKNTPGATVYAIVVHPNDAPNLVQALGNQTDILPGIIIDYPEGLGGLQAKTAAAIYAKGIGIRAADVIINPEQIIKKQDKNIVDELRSVGRHFDKVRAVCQLSYLWQCDKKAVSRLLFLLTEADVYCVKDWVWRVAPASPVATGLETRLQYICHISTLIRRYDLSLLINIAGGVDATNAKQFINAGADFLSVPHDKALSVRNALL